MILPDLLLQEYQYRAYFNINSSNKKILDDRSYCKNNKQHNCRNNNTTVTINKIMNIYRK